MSELAIENAEATMRDNDLMFDDRVMEMEYQCPIPMVNFVDIVLGDYILELHTDGRIVLYDGITEHDGIGLIQKLWNDEVTKAINVLKLIDKI